MDQSQNSNSDSEEDKNEQQQMMKTLPKDFSMKDLMDSSAVQKVQDEGKIPFPSSNIIGEKDNEEVDASFLRVNNPGESIRISALSISDASFLGHQVDNKIYSKMNELRGKNIFEKKSILDFPESQIDPKTSILDFTVDQGNFLGKFSELLEEHKGNQEEEEKGKYLLWWVEPKPKRNIFKKIKKSPGGDGEGEESNKKLERRRTANIDSNKVSGREDV